MVRAERDEDSLLLLRLNGEILVYKFGDGEVFRVVDGGISSMLITFFKVLLRFDDSSSLFFFFFGKTILLLCFD